MCVIVHQPAGAYLSKKTAQEMWTHNSDGGGFAYIGEDQEIHMEHYLDFNKFWGAFESVRSKNRHTDFLIHMRIATSGKVSKENCHPFRVDEHTVMAHNGILNHIVGKIPLTAEKSDTREFVDLVLPELEEDWLDNPVLVDMMENYIGSSKLMFLTTNPKLAKNVYILNEDKGVKRHNMWWSNSNHTFKSWPALTYSDKSNKTKEVNCEVDTKVYQLPLPKDSIEKSVDYESWWEENTAKILSINSASEIKEFMNWLGYKRKEIGISSDIEYDPLNELFSCTKCFFYIDEDSGDCGCWDLLCVNCGQMAPYCTDDPNDAKLVDIQQAHLAYAEMEQQKGTDE